MLSLLASTALAALTWAQIAEDAYRILLPVLTVLAGLLATWLAQKFGAKLDADKQSRLQQQLRDHALDAVATVYQRTVKPLKGTAHTGEFGDAEKARAKETAWQLIEAAAGPVLDAMSHGTNRSTLIGQAIERAVVELGTKTPSGTDAKIPVRVEVAPSAAPAPSSPADDALKDAESAVTEKPATP